MIRDMILPQLGMGMSEGKPVRWLAHEGGRVERDQPLVEIETEKVVTELPAPHSGYLHIVAATDEVVLIETRIAQIADTEAEYRSLLTGVPATSAINARPAPETVAPQVADAGSAPKISGLAKKLAEEHSIPLASLKGTGPKGRIVREDVLRAIDVTRSAPTGAAKTPETDRIRIPIVGTRKMIAERTVKAKTTAAHTYGYFEIDVTALLAARRAMPDPGPEAGGRVSPLSFIARAMALACRDVPICNATLIGDELIVRSAVNVSVIVSVHGKSAFDSTLVSPVVRDAQDKGLAMIDAEIKTLAEKARNGGLSLEDVSDGTITLSSAANLFPGLWALGTPLLYLPQVFAFQPGGAIEKPVVVNGQIAVRTMLPCGISFDHRAMDGEPVGRFITRLASLLGEPEGLMA